jgi:hypothetical protein
MLISSQIAVLFLAGDLANRILCVTDGALNPSFGLIGLSFGLGLGITQGFASLFLDFASHLFQASSYPILIHRQYLSLISRIENTTIRSAVPGRSKPAFEMKTPPKFGGVSA